MTRRLLFSCACLLCPALLLAGCSSLPFFDNSYRYVQPRVAVFKFENKAPFPLKWELGDGMTDLLVNRLMETRRFTVLEREDINTVLSEINLQKSDYTRPEGRVKQKRLANVQYLIKGTITDFTHIAEGGIGIGYRWLRIGGGGTVALVSMVITVIDVESGQVILSEIVQGRTYCGGIDTSGIYNGVAFGGQVFFKMPLGRATRKAMDKATKRIVETIGEERWTPTILAIQPGRIVLNGGADRRLQTGDMYYILRPGEAVQDPNTGNYLGQAPGREVGILQIADVFQKFAYARLCEGAAGKEGYRLRPLTSGEQNALIDRAARTASPPSDEMTAPPPIK